jgi:hypothetical protein
VRGSAKSRTRRRDWEHRRQAQNRGTRSCTLSNLGRLYSSFPSLSSMISYRRGSRSPFVVTAPLSRARRDIAKNFLRGILLGNLLGGPMMCLLCHFQFEVVEFLDDRVLLISFHFQFASLLGLELAPLRVGSSDMNPSRASVWRPSQKHYQHPPPPGPRPRSMVV